MINFPHEVIIARSKHADATLWCERTIGQIDALWKSDENIGSWNWNEEKSLFKFALRKHAEFFALAWK